MAGTYSPSKVAARASRDYAKRIASGEIAPLLPGPSKKVAAKSFGVSPERIASAYDPVFFAENGRAFPIAAKTPKGLASAVAKRRNAGGTLARFESLRASVEAGLGRPVSEASVRALLASKIDVEASYTGRGTRVAAPKTRDDGTTEVVAGLEADAS